MHIASKYKIKWKRSWGISGSEGKFINCQNYGNIEGKNQVAGIVGGVNGGGASASNCQNYGKVKGTSIVAGIGGYQVAISNCRNYGEVDGERTVGGISGQDQAARVSKSINYADVKGNSEVGGIVGNALGVISNCLNYGNVNTVSYAGGIAGTLYSGHPIINCGNIGRIEGAIVGGIVGQTNYASGGKKVILINCYSGSELHGSSKVGGIIATTGEILIENCNFLKEKGVEILASINGTKEINNSEAYEKSFMQSQEFVNILNNYVVTYNEEHKEDSDFVELLTWELDSQTKYPKLNFNDE